MVAEGAVRRAWRHDMSISDSDSPGAERSLIGCLQHARSETDLQLPWEGNTRPYCPRRHSWGFCAGGIMGDRADCSSCEMVRWIRGITRLWSTGSNDQGYSRLASAQNLYL